MNRQVMIYKKFPCNLKEMKYKYGIEYFCDFVFFTPKTKMYMLVGGDLLISEQKFYKGQIITLRDLKKVNLKIKDTRYIRTSNDYPNEPFIHNFNGKEKFYECKYKNSLNFYITSDTNYLWEDKIEKGLDLF